MKENKPSVDASSEATAADGSSLRLRWRRVVKRRSFLHGIGAAAAALPATALFAAERDPDSDRDDKPLNRGDAAIPPARNFVGHFFGNI
jgi:hypothetical protein